MISKILLVFVAILLAFILGAVRRARLQNARLAREHRTMQAELERHRHTAQAILRELQNP